MNGHAAYPGATRLILVLNMDINILEIKENELMHRKEISFEITHLNQGTPNRLEVRDKLAALQTAKPELTFIKTMQPRFGMPHISGSAVIYENEEVADKIEAKYVRIRNMPKDKRTDAWKEARANKKKQ
ncbi:MAG: 30S ribosomal protein S24e [Promethearchaeota archaeon]